MNEINAVECRECHRFSRILKAPKTGSTLYRAHCDYCPHKWTIDPKKDKTVVMNYEHDQKHPRGRFKDAEEYDLTYARLGYPVKGSKYF